MDRDTLAKLWSERLHRMLTIRAFEQRVQELFTEGLVGGSTHLCDGQEAVSVGALEALTESDYFAVTYRGHGHAIARGMPLESAFAEILGRSTGCCGGVGGSMHLTDINLGLLGSFAIVGANLPIAVGAAMSAKLTGAPTIAMAFCGDGATNIGAFHESLNMASVWKAPVVFIVENNLYGEYSPLQTTTSVEDLARRADAHSMPGISIDGQDVSVVSETVAEAVDRARNGRGPTLIEAKTYRFRGHSRTDPARYRPEGELDRWKARDPIDIAASYAVEHGLMTPEQLALERREIEQSVDRAAERALEAPYPTMDEIRDYVYAS